MPVQIGSIFFNYYYIQIFNSVSNHNITLNSKYIKLHLYVRNIFECLIILYLLFSNITFLIDIINFIIIFIIIDV